MRREYIVIFEGSEHDINEVADLANVQATLEDIGLDFQDDGSLMVLEAERLEGQDDLPVAMWQTSRDTLDTLESASA